MHMQNLVELHQFIPKILSRNEIPTSIEGHNSVTYLQKLMCNNPNLNVFNINAYAKFGQIPSTISQDIERKWNSDVNQGRKLTHKNPNLGLVKINAYAKFGQIPSICYQDNNPKLDVININAYMLCKIWSKSIHSFSRYWAETKFWSHSRAITL